MEGSLESASAGDMLGARSMRVCCGKARSRSRSVLHVQTHVQKTRSERKRLSKSFRTRSYPIRFLVDHVPVITQKGEELGEVRVGVGGFSTILDL